MKIIDLNTLDSKIVYEKLDNGLDVYVIRKKNFNSSFCSFVTNFGGINTEFVPIGKDKIVKMPSGIAHFLEHKLFEQEKGDNVHEFYKKSGCYVNAMTGYKRTKYIFNGPKNFKKNLLFLLDFVQSPYFTDKNVEKEKGIIIEEAYMSMDNKNRLFNETILKNLFTSSIYDNTVIGTIDDIKSITKEDLYTCYNTFYNPSNMVLLIVTPYKEEDVIEWVKENQNKKNFNKEKEIITKDFKEELRVRKEYEEIYTNIKENRLCYSLKFDLDYFKCKKIEVFDYFYILFGILLGNLSDFNIKLKEKGIIKDNIEYSINSTNTGEKEFVTFHIYAFCDQEKEFIKLLEKKLLSKDYDEELFNIYKKVIISSINYHFDSVNGIMNFMTSEYEFNKKVSNENIIEEMNLNYEKFVKITDMINLDNKSIVVMKEK